MEKKTYIYIFGESACCHYDNEPEKFLGKNRDEVMEILREMNADGAVYEYQFSDAERKIYEQAIEDCDGWFEHISIVR